MSIRTDLSRIHKLLLVLIVPFVLYLLNVLSFIFIPFAFALFAALFFMPLVRWFQRKKLPNFLALVVVIAIVSGLLTGGYQLIKLSSNELTSSQTDFYSKFDKKLNDIIEPIISLAGIEPKEGETDFEALIHNEKVTESLFGNVGSTLNFTRKTITMTLMTLFFMILLLAGSMNVQQVMDALIFKQRFKSIRTFMSIEKDLFKFIVVKVLLSLFTGLGFSLACLAFDVSFPLFWGLFTFAINFVQMIGSVIAVIVVAAFGLVELEQPGTLLGFALVLTGVQVLFGAILEPILMGKSFSINTVTVLIMLALWGLIWGIPGLILSIPITALVKKILEQFPGTAVYAKIMS